MFFVKKTIEKDMFTIEQIYRAPTSANDGIFL